MNDKKVNHPTHYNYCVYECIDIIEALDLNFNLGNAFKYIWRCGYKDDAVVELEKAKWYLEREIERIKVERVTNNYEEL